MSDNPMSPIERSTPEARVIAFEKQSNSIYNKFSPYDADGSGRDFGSRQPFVWTKITDSDTSKHLTKYDSQAIPIGSTIRDEQRMAKFLTSGTGILYIGKQTLLQNQNVFNETRTYNPLSVLAATAAKGSTGLIDRPKRFIESSGTAGDMVAGALLSLVSIESKTATNTPPNGAADGNTISNQAGITAGANRGLVRFETGKTAISRFSTAWAAAPTAPGGGMLQKLGQSLISKLKSTITNTIPFLSGLGSGETAKWHIRPEYEIQNNGSGPYEAMLSDATGLLSVKDTTIQFQSYSGKPLSSPSSFFNNLLGGLRSRLEDTILGSKPIVRNSGVDTISINAWHRYYPGATDTVDRTHWYTKTKLGTQVFEKDVGVESPVQQNLYDPRVQKNIKEYQVAALQSTYDMFDQNALKKSTERLKFIAGPGDESQDYSSIPGQGDAPPTRNQKFVGKLHDPLTLDRRGFSKVFEGNDIGRADTYNTMEPFSGNRYSNGDAPKELLINYPDDSVNSKDIIFFYFYDLVNSMYIPFRATVAGINDLHTPDWEEISYLGRADKLYVYKGFTRDVNFTFTVYASSLKELLPMWKRINYLVGLTRPSKYTDAPTRTRTISEFAPDNPDGSIGGDEAGLTYRDVTENDSNNTSQFMYPPMVTFRLGDMYVDQPCVLKSIGVNIPETATWETQRGDGSYSYLLGISNIDMRDYSEGKKMYQLPTIVDITINMSIMEKRRSITNDDHFFISNDR